MATTPLAAGGVAYARFFARVLRHRPHMFLEAVRFAIEGYHFEEVTSFFFNAILCPHQEVTR